MRHAELLDCTLRDGAYLIDKRFGENNILGIIRGLVDSGINYIEIGFFQDDGFGDGKSVYRNSEDASRYVPEYKGGSEFTVLADYSRFSVTNLDDRRNDSVDAIRECFFKNERYEALDVCKVIKNRGYKLFIQPVDILGYSDIELVELIQGVNEIEPYCLSIVDTFGSMYQEDLHRVFELIHHNLATSIKLGFHSHNNMQLSSALSQEFIRMTVSKRQCIVDGTLSGMGRGAGNTPIELLVQYLIDKWGYNYNIDALLDTIDGYMDNIRSKCAWGYNTSYFIAGSYGAHVNNIQYLKNKNSIQSKDIRFILNKIGVQARKRYDYDLLEKTYMDMVNFKVDDLQAINFLKQELLGKEILLLIPGLSVQKEIINIKNYIENRNPVVLAVNFIPYQLDIDYVYFSNLNRYTYWKGMEGFSCLKKILASNIKVVGDHNETVVSFDRLIKCGWEHLDNSALMMLRLLDILGIGSLTIAGFDGYSETGKNRNYAFEELEIGRVHENTAALNMEIESMLIDYNRTRSNKFDINFLTESRFLKCFM